MNWIAECVAVVGQVAFLAGDILFYRNGLGEWRLHNGEEVW